MPVSPTVAVSVLETALGARKGDREKEKVLMLVSPIAAVTALEMALGASKGDREKEDAVGKKSGKL